MRNNVIDFQPKETKKINKKKLAITISIIVLLLTISILAIIYCLNKNFRNVMDVYLFRKNISGENTTAIDIGYETNTNIIGYYKYICILSENKLKQYNASGKLENELEVKINVPIYDAKGKYLVIGEKNSKKIYLICDNSIVWETEVEGNVSKIDVNENGYVSIILKGTTYKSVIVVYDAKGNELFKTYLSKTSAVDACISKDNKYLSFAEVNTTGTVIQSNIKTISMDKAKQEPSQAIVYTYAANSNDLIINLKYHDKNKLICMYDNSIHLITNDIDENIMQLDENTKKADIELENYAIKATEQTTGLFSADTNIEIRNISNNKIIQYTVEGVAKNIYCRSETIAINIGSEVEFIHTNGWLIKRYKSLQEVKDVVLCDGAAAIIYRDKIEIINL